MRLEEGKQNGAVIAARLEGLIKRYPNGTLAIDRMDLTVGKGEFVSLLEPSGCGKSTALYILAGLANATAGRVEFAGDSRQAVGTGSMGFVFQEPNLTPWAAVSENVALPLTLRGSAVDLASEVIRCLTMVGLETFADACPRELTGGTKMRVSIARALITRPQFLLLDEPFGALDEITRARLYDDLLRIWSETGCTIVMETHNTTESVCLSNRVVVMAARPGRFGRCFRALAADRGIPPRSPFLRSCEAGFGVNGSRLFGGIHLRNSCHGTFNSVENGADGDINFKGSPARRGLSVPVSGFLPALC